MSKVGMSKVMSQPIFDTLHEQNVEEIWFNNYMWDELTFERIMSSSMLSILWLSLVMFISPYSALASAIFSRFSRIKI